MTQPVAAGAVRPASRSTFVRFFVALAGLSIVLALLGASIGLSAGIAHLTYRLVIR